MLNIQNLQVSFGDKEVLKGVDLTVNKGDVVTFIGPSGTGKTTILKCINYLVEPDGGQMQLSNVSVDFKKINKKEILQLRRNTAMVFQQFNLFKNKTVVENVMDAQIAVQKKSKKEAYEKSIGLLEKVGLLEKENEYPSRLSGGQQQRVSIARALAVEPEVILFDEPTSSLDPELVAEVLKVIESVAKTGVTILLVTHEMSFARKVSNKIVFMEKGKIVEEGSPEQIFESSQNERTKQFLKNYYAEAAEMMQAAH
ncbi:amino acid ABC transporter ATP-binding protein [Virgibacillus halodenitrificans]|uniref:amino acid ABC transporter ATP-binding protein n=1 Tax=Virgibacillus halodenitrificans TaxID=1482 RepID=UPI00045CE72C|nr:amino acid ABC transporter ATP-binding protein [Virgibacillus halodenitrificans]MEC2159745.1 amino acid ABC transporter ATP-binding protein [Virgibacillus halodenitrificans]CDQ31388.1 L-cystine import ATP-binding protein TcyN [Virgibacillus halodenitrificans]